MNCELKPLPRSWSELTWQQLCRVWSVKMRYGGNPDVARCAALLALLGCSVCRDSIATTADTGEALYTLRDREGRQFTVTPRSLAHLAAAALPWFDYPYGDPGQKEERDEKGNVTKERREARAGLVNPIPDWRDALAPPIEVLKIGRRHFQLPGVACYNLTWQQYRSLQAIVQQLFQEGISPEQALTLQAQFLAHILTPRSLALFDTNGGSIRLRLHHEYNYNTSQAEGFVPMFERRLRRDYAKMDRLGKVTAPLSFGEGLGVGLLYHICLQTYQTAVQHYERIYPLLFGDSGKSDPLRTALSGESGTINAVMKYAGYDHQQQVYDSNLPFVLDILNTMTKEAKDIEKMNAKIKRK